MIVVNPAREATELRFWNWPLNSFITVLLWFCQTSINNCYWNLTLRYYIFSNFFSLIILFLAFLNVLHRFQTCSQKIGAFSQLNILNSKPYTVIFLTFWIFGREGNLDICVANQSLEIFSKIFTGLFLFPCSNVMTISHENPSKFLVKIWTK